MSTIIIPLNMLFIYSLAFATSPSPCLAFAHIFKARTDKYVRADIWAFKKMETLPAQHQNTKESLNTIVARA